jgi:hypothetical protein
MLCVCVWSKQGQRRKAREPKLPLRPATARLVGRHKFTYGCFSYCLVDTCMTQNYDTHSTESLSAGEEVGK